MRRGGWLCALALLPIAALASPPKITDLSLESSTSKAPLYIEVQIAAPSATSLNLNMVARDAKGVAFLQRFQRGLTRGPKRPRPFRFRMDLRRPWPRGAELKGRVTPVRGGVKGAELVFVFDGGSKIRALPPPAKSEPAQSLRQRYHAQLLQRHGGSSQIVMALGNPEDGLRCTLKRTLRPDGDVTLTPRCGGESFLEMVSPRDLVYLETLIGDLVERAEYVGVTARLDTFSAGYRDAERLSLIPSTPDGRRPAVAPMTRRHQLIFPLNHNTFRGGEVKVCLRDCETEVLLIAQVALDVATGNYSVLESGPGPLRKLHRGGSRPGTQYFSATLPHHLAVGGLDALIVQLDPPGSQ